MEDQAVRAYPVTGAENSSQPGMKDAFAKVYGTDDLVVSFDQMNLTLPVNEKTGRKDIEITEPWPRESHRRP